MESQIKRSFAILLASVIAALAIPCGSLSSQAAPIKVTCVGDSITAGYGLANSGTQSYPAQLQTLLGSGYTVENDGDSARTLQKATGYSYWNSWAYTNSLNSSPNFVVIMLGANDALSWNWNAANFNSDYRALISNYTNLATHPKVLICYTPPMYPVLVNYGMYFDPVFVENTVEPAIATISTQAGVQLIDNDTPLLNRQDLFQDGVHPTTAGAAIVAQQVYNAIKGLAPTNITTAAITSSGTPSVYGSPVTYTATLTSSAGTVTGAVVFAANNVPFSTNTLSGGVASTTNSLVPIGANVVAAQYVSQGKFLGNTHSLQQIVTDPNGPTLSNLGGSTPVPGPNDISQLSTSGTTWPDGLNYFTDNGAPAGQTFTTPAKTLNLVTVAVKTAGLNNGGGYGTPASTPTLYLRIYSRSGSTATLLKTLSAPNPGYTDGAWLRWSNFSVTLSASQTYAYSFGSKPDAGGWAALSVAANAYAGGEIGLIPINGGTITNGSSHSFDATFVLGLVTNTPPVLAAITNRSVNVGQTVAFTASATDTDAPPQTLTFALLAGTTNATLITNSGAFSFRPLVTQANSTNNFTLKVSDNGSPVLSATQSFYIAVNPLTAAGIGNVSVAGNQPSFQVSGQNGPDYAIETSTNLTQWSNVFITNSPMLPFIWTAAATNGPQRFYRVKLGPPLP